ncbi:MAG: hypothetical protein KBT67_05975 [bacterium]|nr:hypothetical protein [Candidatus Limimorpha caballi]
MNTTKNAQSLIKIGRLKMTIAKAIKRKCADIYITDNYLKHISNYHRIELESLGINALDYVKLIATNFTQIRKGSGDSLLLVIYRDDVHDTAAISLSLNGDIWEVRTAQPRRTKEIEKKELLWSKNKKVVGLPQS